MANKESNLSVTNTLVSVTRQIYQIRKYHYVLNSLQKCDGKTLLEMYLLKGSRCPRGG
jgi:hypothetical protein